MPASKLDAWSVIYSICHVKSVLRRIPTNRVVQSLLIAKHLEQQPLILEHRFLWHHTPPDLLLVIFFGHLFITCLHQLVDKTRLAGHFHLSLFPHSTFLLTFLALHQWLLVAVESSTVFVNNIIKIRFAYLQLVLKTQLLQEAHNFDGFLVL